MSILCFFSNNLCFIFLIAAEKKTALVSTKIDELNLGKNTAKFSKLKSN